MDLLVFFLMAIVTLSSGEALCEPEFKVYRDPDKPLVVMCCAISNCPAGYTAQMCESDGTPERCFPEMTSHIASSTEAPSQTTTTNIPSKQTTTSHTTTDTVEVASPDNSVINTSTDNPTTKYEKEKKPSSGPQHTNNASVRQINVIPLLLVILVIYECSGYVLKYLALDLSHRLFFFLKNAPVAPVK